MASETRAAGTAQDDIHEQASEHTLAANPLVGVRGQDILNSARMLLGKMANNPAVAARQYLSFLGELGRIATGGSELAPDAKDKRFADPAWKDSVSYRALAQCYLAWGGALNGSSTRRRWTSATPSARALSSRCSSTRCRRPIGSAAIPRR